MRNRFAIALVQAIAASIGGCDAIVIRQSFVKVAPDSFPSCAASALVKIGYKPTQCTESNGKKRLYVGYPHGDLNATVTESAPGQSQTVQLSVAVMLRGETANQAEARLADDLGSITTAIARSCGDG